MQIPLQSSGFTGHANQKGDVDAASPSSCVCLESSHEEFFVAISTIDFSNHNAPDFLTKINDFYIFKIEFLSKNIW